ncbi:glucose-1-phosphate cytidylyltransferase [Alphaproteobacteria bacterium]|nr:glucose-1-phosphate cytidylyltransferase [Alphaproteobacteria bacterium]
MKVVILAGGLGTRLAEETTRVPKPLVEIGGKPIIWHIMKIYHQHGLRDFIVCLGYKGSMIKQYFIDYANASADLTLNLAKNEITEFSGRVEDWRISFIDTGDSTQTGGRLKAVGNLLPKNQSFCLTYGDGVGNIDIFSAINFHKQHGKLATVTAVTPPGRFGVLDIEKDDVVGFKEKPNDASYRINAGFFVLEPRVLDYIEGPHTSWEASPMGQLANDGQLKAFAHNGFWMPMDTLRDKTELNNIWSSGNAPWKTWQ